MMWLARRLVARNPALTITHAKRLATVGMVAGALILAALAFLLWLHFHDARVREDTNLRRDNADLTANAEANASAGLSKVARDRTEAAQQRKLEHDVEKADAAGRSAADDAWNGGLFDE